MSKRKVGIAAYSHRSSSGMMEVNMEAMAYDFIALTKATGHTLKDIHDMYERLWPTVEQPISLLPSGLSFRLETDVKTLTKLEKEIQGLIDKKESLKR